MQPTGAPRDSPQIHRPHWELEEGRQKAEAKSLLLFGHKISLYQDSDNETEIFERPSSMLKEDWKSL